MVSELSGKGFDSSTLPNQFQSQYQYHQFQNMYVYICSVRVARNMGIAVMASMHIFQSATFTMTVA